MTKRIVKNGRENSIEFRVRYSEVDRMGLFYHVNHLEYFELARAEWLRRSWKPYKELEDAGMALVVVEARIKYLRPAFYDDLLTVSIKAVGWNNIRFEVEYEMLRKGEAKPICTGRTLHCFVNRHGKAVRIPDDFRDAVLESNAGKR